MRTTPKIVYLLPYRVVGKYLQIAVGTYTKSIIMPVLDVDLPNNNNLINYSTERNMRKNIYKNNIVLYKNQTCGI